MILIFYFSYKIGLNFITTNDLMTVSVNQKLLDKYDYSGHILIMVSVGIRELKSHLSQYIDLVKKGESVLITEHNKVVAELKFLEPKPSDDTKIKEVFSKLVSEKKMIPAKRKSTAISKKPLNTKKIKQKDWWNFYQEAKEDK